MKAVIERIEEKRDEKRRKENGNTKKRYESSQMHESGYRKKEKYLILIYAGDGWLYDAYTVKKIYIKKIYKRRNAYSKKR